jgi:GntR family transcriptional regulator
MLAREIQAGILLDGTRLPPERAMAEQFGVAIGTLRKALLDLSEKGLLERVQGSGNYVRHSTDISDSAIAKTVYGFFRLELISGGGLPTADFISVSKVKKPAGIADIGKSTHGHRIRRLRRLNGIDAAIEEIWIDSTMRSHISKQELYDSLYLFYKEKLGFWISRVEDRVSAQGIPDWKPDDFGSQTKNANSMWGYIERVSFNQSNVCVEYSKTWFDPHTTRFVSRMN